jgi:hypothetical protein
MLPDYADIRALTDTEPLWFDGNGVPRYATFDPDMLGVYDKFAMLVEIECQACAQRFLVGQGWAEWDLLYDFQAPHKNSLESLATGYHYGDPPRHGGAFCPAGDTMNCIDVRIVEAWEKVWSSTGFEWIRHPKIEAIDIMQDWARER